jgi:hypothetical protein
MINVRYGAERANGRTPTGADTFGGPSAARLASDAVRAVPA